MQRPDLRDISGNIREALEGCERDVLLDILTFVFKEYLVEGPPPLMVHQQERIGDLEGLSFAELITTLQTRLDMPELGLFQVEGEQVSVRVNGVLTPLSLRATRAPQRPAARPPQPGVQVIETDIVQRPPARRHGTRHRAGRTAAASDGTGDPVVPAPAAEPGRRQRWG